MRHITNEYTYVFNRMRLYGIWGQEYKYLKKWSDLMPINVTVTNSGNISLQETLIKILVFTLAASRLNSKVYLFTFTHIRSIVKVL